MGSWEGRGNQYIQLVKLLYCKLPINGKQLPAFLLQVGLGTKHRSTRLEARVLPLCHCDPQLQPEEHNCSGMNLNTIYGISLVDMSNSQMFHHNLQYHSISAWNLGVKELLSDRELLHLRDHPLESMCQSKWAIFEKWSKVKIK